MDIDTFESIAIALYLEPHLSLIVIGSVDLEIIYSDVSNRFACIFLTRIHNVE